MFKTEINTYFTAQPALQVDLRIQVMTEYCNSHSDCAELRWMLHLAMETVVGSERYEQKILRAQALMAQHILRERELVELQAKFIKQHFTFENIQRMH